MHNYKNHGLGVPMNTQGCEGRDEVTSGINSAIVWANKPRGFPLMDESSHFILQGTGGWASGLTLPKRGRKADAVLN